MSKPESEVIEVEAEAQKLPAQPATNTLPAITPMQMLQTAVEQGADLDKMQKLMELQERWEGNEARKAYVAAMSQFKKNPPEIFKNKAVSFETRAGDKTSYSHATLDHVANVISEAMGPHGLSFSWEVDQSSGIKVTCIVTHQQGHSERVSLQAAADDSGKKNQIQAIGSTVTYLQRYTLLSAAGLAAKGMDDDGKGSAPKDFITEEQQADIRALLDETKTDLTRYLKWIKVNSLSEILAMNYNPIITALEKLRK